MSDVFISISANFFLQFCRELQSWCPEEHFGEKHIKWKDIIFLLFWTLSNFFPFLQELPAVMSKLLCTSLRQRYQKNFLRKKIYILVRNLIEIPFDVRGKITSGLTTLHSTCPVNNFEEKNLPEKLVSKTVVFGLWGKSWDPSGKIIPTRLSRLYSMFPERSTSRKTCPMVKNYCFVFLVTLSDLLPLWQEKIDKTVKS